jgi:hypothetical protein
MIHIKRLNEMASQQESLDFPEYARENVAFRMDKAMSGYYRLLMYSPEAEKRHYGGQSVFLSDDPAAEDMFDYDIAREQFEEYLSEKFDDRTLNVINRAVGEFNYQLSDTPKDMGEYDIEELVCECENLIFDKVASDGEYDYCELHYSGHNQYYNYYDGDFTKNCSGEIWHYDRRGDFYGENSNGEIDFDHPLKGYELERGRSYAFIYDRVINSDAKVVGLYDFYKE